LLLLAHFGRLAALCNCVGVGGRHSGFLVFVCVSLFQRAICSSLLAGISSSHCFFETHFH